jgi:hypothetical protein
MKKNLESLNEKMRKSKNQFIKTLIDGEESGHCYGIK